MLGLPVVTREMTGKRLLFVSRRALDRISTLAMAWHFTGDSRYADRGVRRMVYWTDCNGKSLKTNMLTRMALKTPSSAGPMAKAASAISSWTTLSRAGGKCAVSTISRLADPSKT